VPDLDRSHCPSVEQMGFAVIVLHLALRAVHSFPSQICAVAFLAYRLLAAHETMTRKNNLVKGRQEWTATGVEEEAGVLSVRSQAHWTAVAR
jgi:hypothetical protein